ncbi:HNH endonuclease [Calothrix sp. HK-06]|nr:HNH endonuclease [Calothrix sp. HK-06]
MHTNYVFLLNADKSPLGMIHPARARELQDKKKAAVFRRYPYVLILRNQVNSVIKACILKIDPGSKWTGFAIQMGSSIILRMELEHRGEIIKLDLEKRAGFRRGRRSRNLRYRMERSGRRKKEGWLPPSLRHRLLTVETWIKRFMRYCPIITIEIEQVRFDTQKMNNPEIKGVEYQQGELMGYEVRQYLLEKWGNECTYCGVKNVPLEVEHVKPKSKGGSDRVSNLTLACHCCNQKKGDKDVSEFVSDKAKLDIILSQAKTPLKDAAAVNSTRFAIVETAKKLCDNVKCWTGGRTKFNRFKQGFEKSHSIDAACVGESGSNIKIKTQQPLIVVCKGHGSRQARRVNKYGFPAVQKAKAVFTHATAGDLVRVVLDSDRKNVTKGKYIARVKTPTKKAVEVVINGKRVEISSMKNVSFIQRSDGYAYSF